MSCSPPRVILPPLRLTRGASHAWVFTVRTAADNALVNLTGALVWFTAKSRIEDLAATFTKRNLAAGGVDNQILILSPQSGITLGKFKVFVDPADTSPLDPDAPYWCDAFVQLPGGPPIDRQQVMENRQLVVRPAVTTSF